MKKIFFIAVIMVIMSLGALGDERRRILILDSQSTEPYKSTTETIIAQLKKDGFEDGKNLIIKREILGNFEGRGYNTLKAEANTKYDAIILNGTFAGMAGKKFIEEVKPAERGNYKFLFINITDPVGMGLIEKLNVQSNTNFTGIAYPVKVEEKLRLIKSIFGANVKVGYIYGDMPQSLAYNKWLNDDLEKEEFKEMKFIFRKVEFVKSDGGTKRMTMLAEEYVKELDKEVDVFLSPNDQMGISDDFGQMIEKTATKPLIGIANEKGRTIAIATDIDKNAKKLVGMIEAVFAGKNISELIPVNSESIIKGDMDKINKFKLKIPKNINIKP